MSIPGSANPLLLASAAAAGGYEIERSLRFNSADSAYLSRTPASAGNRKTWTWSGWVKRSAFGTAQVLFSATDGSTPFTIYLDTDNTLFIGDPSFAWKVTSQVFRDSAAWGHLVVACDTTQASNADRAKIYWNGTQATLSTDRNLYSNTDLAINGTFAHNIGRNSSSSSLYFNGYLADIHFIDGQALTPSSFAETDATTGAWNPKAYSGGYGTNGFHLDFADNSNNTASTLGKDTSGNGNNWTPNNLSVTAGAGNDSLVDSPTNYGTDTGVGGEVRGNYCTLNPLKYGGDIQAPTNGNLDVISVGSATGKILGTIGVSSGKWYWECVPNSNQNIAFGITKDNTVLANYPGQDAVDYSYHNHGSKYSNNSGSAYGASFTTNDVIGVALDADNGTLTFYKNNSSQGQAYSGLTSGPYFPMVGDPSSAPDISATANFGQRPFAYTAPSGFKALCTANLPTPTIPDGSKAMDVKLYTGNGGSQTISGLGFSPDLVWIKGRSGATDNTLYDIVRGAEKRLESNNTDAEVTSDGGLTAFNSDGFALSTLAQVNTSSATYAGWCWDAGSSTVTNTQGSITSSVRANASAGFSVVTYTGNGTSGATIGHGLGVAPSLILVKCRSNAAGWLVYHNSTGATKYLALESTAAAGTYSGAWNDTAPTSTVFSVGNDSSVNTSSRTYVAYCWAPVSGYSSFGSYDAGTDPFVYLGFRPAMLMIKSSNGAENWNIIDCRRNGVGDANVVTYSLQPNSSGAEYQAEPGIDLLSNGFKLRGSFNSAGGQYIYAAWASSPFAYARAR